jgi:hypothetical protein
MPTLTYTAIAIAGLAFVAFVLIGDRPRGRHRCRRCWYALDNAGDLPVTCPECGTVHEQTKHLMRTRRRGSFALPIVFAALIGAWLAYHAPQIRARGWWAAAPTPLLLLVIDPEQFAKTMPKTRQSRPPLWGLAWNAPTPNTPASHAELNMRACVEGSWQQALTVWWLRRGIADLAPDGFALGAFRNRDMIRTMEQYEMVISPNEPALVGLILWDDTRTIDTVQGKMMRGQGGRTLVGVDAGNPLAYDWIPTYNHLFIWATPEVLAEIREAVARYDREGLPTPEYGPPRPE